MEQFSPKLLARPVAFLAEESGQLQALAAMSKNFQVLLRYSNNYDVDFQALDTKLQAVKEVVVVLCASASSDLWLEKEHGPATLSICEHLLTRHEGKTLNFMVLPTTEDAKKRWKPGDLPPSLFRKFLKPSSRVLVWNELHCAASRNGRPPCNGSQRGVSIIDDLALSESSRPRVIRRERNHMLWILVLSLFVLREWQSHMKATTLQQELEDAQAAGEAKATKLHEQLEQAQAAGEAKVTKLQQQLEDAQAAGEAKTTKLQQELKEAQTAGKAKVTKLQQELKDAQAAGEATVKKLQQQLEEAQAAGEANSTKLQQELKEAQAAGEAKATELQQQLEEAQAAGEANSTKLQQELKEAQAAGEAKATKLQQEWGEFEAKATKRQQELEDAKAAAETMAANLQVELQVKQTEISQQGAALGRIGNLANLWQHGIPIDCCESLISDKVSLTAS